MNMNITKNTTQSIYRYCQPTRHRIKTRNYKDATKLVQNGPVSSNKKFEKVNDNIEND